MLFRSCPGWEASGLCGCTRKPPAECCCVGSSPRKARGSPVCKCKLLSIFMDRISSRSCGMECPDWELLNCISAFCWLQVLQASSVLDLQQARAMCSWMWSSLDECQQLRPWFSARYGGWSWGISGSCCSQVIVKWSVRWTGGVWCGITNICGCSNPHTHCHEFWAVTKRMKLHIQKTKMSFLCRVADAALEKGQELAHRKEAWSRGTAFSAEVVWTFGQDVYQAAPLGHFWARPTGDWRDNISNLARRKRGIPQKQLKSVAGEWDLWTIPVSQPPSWPHPR